ncbi:translation initiation factor IF-2 subunit gamma [Candidatus Bathyarchaeota archaeon]|nr:MAG: translation initiation factor IF-2 subunit gamma [Candidatus Bathyarchaeota archaeon]TMI60081.1 MAG: translation initiation factor IF-2 subunit gamma [Candidatus Bathyarchaeota archaeon]
MGEGSLQPEINIGTLGHVDNGKSTIVQALTGVWTARHSEELRRGITIRIGYADASFYECPSCEPPYNYSTSKICPNCKSETKFLRSVSFVDCPGHHSLMVTMLSGAAIMDGSMFVISANVKCPQAQDREHMLAAQMVGLRKMVVVQNKIDVVDRARAKVNYQEIREFTKDTVAGNAPVIPVSAQHKLNMDVLIAAIQEKIPTPKRDSSVAPRMSILRSFDVNKPGTEVEDILGGVVGGSVVQGVFKRGEEIEIKPGIKVGESNRVTYERLVANVETLQAGDGEVKQAMPGGLIAVGTDLDPSITKSDGLVGNVLGRSGTLPDILEKVSLNVDLFERAVGTEQLVPVQKIKMNEPLVLNAGTAVTSGLVVSAREDIADVQLKKPICADPGSKVALSRRIGESWRLIGFGTIR